MRIVIDISEKDYETIKDVYPCVGFIGYVGVKTAFESIINGVLLPKGHGRLIDADAIIQNGCYYETEMDLNDALTIIEAECCGGEK